MVPVWQSLKQMPRCLRAGPSLCLAVIDTVSAQTGRFILKVSHPEQPVEFSYSGGLLRTLNMMMLVPGGEEVPYQQLFDRGRFDSYAASRKKRAERPADQPKV